MKKKNDYPVGQILELKNDYSSKQEYYLICRKQEFKNLQPWFTCKQIIFDKQNNDPLIASTKNCYFTEEYLDEHLYDRIKFDNNVYATYSFERMREIIHNCFHNEEDFIIETKKSIKDFERYLS
jgi:hypothetical protein